MNRIVLFATAAMVLASTADISAIVNQPVLKWARAGCYSSWCETGWYSSPAVADLNGDGMPEIVAGAYTINILKGIDGSETASFNKNGSRVWSGIIVADINNDGRPEIVAASGGQIIVRDYKGDTLWTKQIITNELRGIAAAADLDSAKHRVGRVGGGSVRQTHTKEVSRHAAPRRTKCASFAFAKAPRPLALPSRPYWPTSALPAYQSCK